MDKPDLKGVVVCHFDEDGNESYHVYGDAQVRLFIVDERAPGDRVYEILSRAEPATFRKMIPEDAVIGNNLDERHPALSAAIIAHLEGRPHLSVVENGHG